MTQAEFKEISKYINAMYKDTISDETAGRGWYESLRRYSCSDIMDAIARYIRDNHYPPHPSDIIDNLPVRRTNSQDLAPRFENIDGKRVRIYNCTKCNDQGMVAFTDEESNFVGKPCECYAGFVNYPWEFLTKYEKEEYNKREHQSFDTTENEYYLNIRRKNNWVRMVR